MHSTKRGRAGNWYRTYSVGGGKVVDGSPATAPVSLYRSGRWTKSRRMPAGGRAIWKSSPHRRPTVWIFGGSLNVMTDAIRAG
jgi:hypothetical protein